MNFPRPYSRTAPFAAPTWRNVGAALSGIMLLWLCVLYFKLTPAVFAIVITYGAAHNLEQKIRRKWPNAKHAAGLALLVSLGIVALFVTFAAILVSGTRHTPATFANVFQQMAQILDQVRYSLPGSISAMIPPTMDALREQAVHLLNRNAAKLQLFGSHTLRGLGYILAGVVIGALLVLQLPPLRRPHGNTDLLGFKLHYFFLDLVNCFVEIVFAQFKISAINAILTAVYLLVILPLVGKPLPMAGTLVALTFLTGLIPILGNLISNTVIVVISLSLSVTDAVLSLIFLMTIHKLEYFLNAKIIGDHIRSRAWELLLMMLVMEAVFGLAGLICAPVIYAQVKNQLHRHGWIE